MHRYLQTQSVRCRALARVFHRNAHRWSMAMTALSISVTVASAVSAIVSLTSADRDLYRYLTTAIGFATTLVGGLSTTFSLWKRDAACEAAGDDYDALAERIDAELATEPDGRRLKKLVARHRAARKEIDQKHTAPAESAVDAEEMLLRRQLNALNRLSMSPSERSLVVGGIAGGGIGEL